MPMTKGDVRIYYETMGPSDGVPILFVQGFSGQLIGWREDFCQLFVDRGAFVIRYDNRDVGLSQKFGGPSDFDGGYTLEDMAYDGFSVLDDLGLESAHVVGASMGGMISQAMALSWPSRVRSLNLIYTAPSFDPAYFVPHEIPSPASMARPLEREEAIEKFVKDERISASTAYPFDEKWAREHGGLAYDRCHAPTGVFRQAYAVTRWAPKLEALNELKMPSSIIHGRVDARIRVVAALDLARLLKDSELHIYPGMGHEIPRPLWGEFVTQIMRTSGRE